jgi:hypothetical protein
MEETHGLSPDIVSFNTAVHACARAGKVRHSATLSGSALRIAVMLGFAVMV